MHRLIAGLLFSAVAHADTSFIFMGDTGTGESGQYAVSNGIERYCKLHACDFGLLLGDNFYPLGVFSQKDKQWKDKFEEPYRNLSFKFYPVLGNHDYYNIYGWKVEIAYKSSKWSMPDRYYSHNLPGIVEIIGIDTERFDREQIDWLTYRLKNSKATWKVLYGHKPIYSSGEHGDSVILKSALLPMMRYFGVDFYLSGHDHHLEYIERDGINFVVSGAGAKVRDKVKPGKYTKYVSSQLGFSHLILTDKGSVLRMLNRDGKELYRSYKILYQQPKGLPLNNRALPHTVVPSLSPCVIDRKGS